MRSLRTCIVAAILAILPVGAMAAITVAQTVSAKVVGTPPYQQVSLTATARGTSTGAPAVASASVSWTDPDTGAVQTLDPIMATVYLGQGQPASIPKISMVVTYPSAWTLVTNPVATGVTNPAFNVTAGRMTLTGDTTDPAGCSVTWQVAPPSTP